MSALHNPPVSLELGKLLVVDDDANFRAALARPLRHLGYSVDAARDGQEAFERLERADYDLVLLDQLMPGLSGLQTLRRLRTLYSPSDLPVIMFSGSSDSSLVVQALDLGANDYVAKPIDMPATLARVHSQLARRQTDRLSKVAPAARGSFNRRLLMKRMRSLPFSAADDLKHATERGEMITVYQPIVNLATGEIGGFECLLRWNHPLWGWLAPSLFIPVAEEIGAIVQIGRWALKYACIFLKAVQEKFSHSPALTMSVNLSARQLGDDGLVAHIADILAQTGIPPQTFKLELTEKAVIGDIERARTVLAELRSLGIALDLDDFGSGYSSFSYLRGFSFHSLKIDHSFISGLGSDTGSRPIVGTIIDLAHAMNMEVVAEGVETEKQLMELIHLDCDRGQGSYLSPPLEESAIKENLFSGAGRECGQKS